MANPEHLAILKQGREIWNSWKAEIFFKGVHPDLSGADDFAGIMIKLEQVDLDDANLHATNFAGTDLFLARFRHADMSSANLAGAFLSNTDFTDTNLSNANLRQARIIDARFDETELGGSDFSDAEIQITVFRNVDLSAVKGLDTVRHTGPSTIGIDTLYKSKGNIPEVFLRGCGVPEDMIAYARSLLRAGD